MGDNMLIGFHRSALSNYKELFEGDSVGGVVSNESVAYNILQHSGMLYRYTADTAYLENLKELDTKVLLVNGFRYVKALDLINPLKAILHNEEISDVQMQDLECIISVRDELEEFCNIVYMLLAESISIGDYSFVSELAEARSYANEFDRTAGKDPALISIAASDFSGLRNLFAIKCKKENYWWMYLSEEYSTAGKTLCQSIERISNSPDAIARLLEHSASKYPVDDSPESESVEEEKVISLLHIWAKACEYARVPAAASDSDAAVSAALLWDGVSDCFSICGSEQEAPGASGCYARLVNALKAEEDGSASAEWKIHGTEFTGEAKSTFYLLARDTRKVIGTGVVDAEGYAVLGNASWDEVKVYASDYSRLILLVVKKR